MFLFLTAQANLRNALKENAELAQRYRELQRAVVLAKREAGFTSSEKNRAEASFHNHTQVKINSLSDTDDTETHASVWAAFSGSIYTRRVHHNIT